MKTVLFFIALIYPLLSFANTSEISVTKRSDQAYILAVGYSTNIGLFKTTAGIVLVDPMPGDGHLEALNSAIKNIFVEQPYLILNTHEHSDHSGGNSYFVNKGGELLKTTIGLKEFETATVKSHSSSDSIFLHRPSNTIFVGDIYTTNWHPTFYAGGLSGFVDAMDTILNLGDENSLIVPGHGKPTSKEELKLFRQNTLEWVAEVKALSNKGLSVSEIKQNEQIKSLLLKFNLENKSDFIPESAFERFIGRTLTLIENAE